MNLRVILRLLGVALFLFLGLLNSRCATAANPNFSKTIALSPKEGTILFNLYFKAEDVFGKQTQHQALEVTYWTPTAAEIIQAREGLGTYLPTSAFDPTWNRFGYQPSSIALTRDFNQYVGILWNGKKCILINGFTASNAPLFAPTLEGTPPAGTLYDPPRQFSDGGSVFRAVYDPVTRRIEYLVFDNFVESEPFRTIG